MFITAPTDNITSTKDWPRHPAELLDQYATAPAANVGDVFDRLLVLDSGIRCLTSQHPARRHRPADPDPGRGQPGHPLRPGRRPTR